MLHVDLPCRAHSQLVAWDVLPELRTVVQVDGGTVIFIATYGHHLLACRQLPLRIDMPGERHPVRGIPERLFRPAVQPLAVAEVQSLDNLAVHAEVEELPLESRVLIQHMPIEVFPRPGQTCLELQSGETGSLPFHRLPISAVLCLSTEGHDTEQSEHEATQQGCV